jgi:hypothetical protein
MLHVFASFPCYMPLLHVHAAFPCCMSFLHVFSDCPNCMCTSMVNVHVECPCCISIHIHPCPCMGMHAMLLVDACQCCTFLPHSIFTSTLHVYTAYQVLPVHAACSISVLHDPAACPCCMFLLHVRAACPFCTSLLDFLSACPRCMSRLHVHAACPLCRRCTYKTSKDITSKNRTSKDIRSQPQNVPAPKRPKYKTSQASKRPKPQNVPAPKRPKYKTSKPQNDPSLKTSQKCPRIRDQGMCMLSSFHFLLLFSVNRLHTFAELYKGTVSRDIL